MTFKKAVVFGLIGLIVLAGILWVANKDKIERLQRVTSLFDADKIVHNFSNMDEVLFTRELGISGDAHIWPEALTGLPEQVDIRGERRNLQSFLDETKTTAFLVIRDGTILYENYYLGTGSEDRRISWSMAKSYLSAMMGQFVESGAIESLEDPVDKYVPALADGAYAGVPIRHVLNMSSGVKFNEDYMDPKSDINKMAGVLALGKSMDGFTTELTEIAYPSGTARQYVSTDTHVLGMITRAVSGRSLHDIFEQTYGTSLGFGKAPYYLTDGEGVAFAMGGLNMRTRDYALFGEMIRHGGKWRGKQVVSPDWIDLSTHNSAPSKDLNESGIGYGYQWWVPVPEQGDFFAVGIYEQYIYINPDAKMVIVKNSANRNFKGVPQSGTSYKEETIDMMRSLAAYYAGETGQP